MNDRLGVGNARRRLPDRLRGSRAASTLALLVALCGATTPSVSPADSSQTTESLSRTGTRVPRGTPEGSQATTARTVAITFDDLPLGGPQFGVERMTTMTEKLVGEIVGAGVPAVGFVNEGKVDVGGEIDARLALLRTWASAGLELGNHTYSHPSPHDVPLQQYFDDIVRGEPYTRALMAEHGRELRWFRHPFLFRGLTLADKEAIDTFLAERNYRIAPVTMDNADYVYSALYTEAKGKGDTDAMQRIAEAYLAFSGDVYAFYENAAEAMFGRDIPHVYLLHANELNADTFGRFAALTRARGYEFVTLDQAVSDPAYASPDRYAGPAGTSWVFRWDATQAQESGARKVDWRAEPTVHAWVQEAFENR